MTYLPLLSTHILDEMDVEALTAELQSLSRAATKMQRNIPPVQQEPAVVSPQPQQSPNVGSAWSLESSVELVRSSDARSEASSASFLSVSPRPETSQLADSITSWVEPPQSPEAPSLERPGSSSIPLAPPSEANAPSESVVSSSVVSSSSDSGLVSGRLDVTVASDPFITAPRLIYLPLIRALLQEAKRSFGERSKCLVRHYHFILPLW